MEETILSVSDCIALINQTLEYAYPIVTVEGEVASFKVSKGKFIFFDVKDDEGVLNCFMMAYGLRTPLEDGMRVRVLAQPRLTAWGKFSLTVRDIRAVGEGSIKRSFELLKAQLDKEGLFDSNRKRPLPTMPERIGVIASVESAGYADFIKILQNRWGGVEVEVADVQVQGMRAGMQIINAMSHFNEHRKPVEVLILIRGGGSAEDLAIFNEEPLVRAVAASRIPTLVGVGHEVDVSLCDLVADVRAATPSHAAQLVVPDRQALLNELSEKERHLVARLHQHVQHYTVQVNKTTERLLSHIHHVLVTQLHHVEYSWQILKQLDPKTVLRRGYSLVRASHGVLVRKAADVREGDTLTIEVEHAIIQAGVKNVRKK